MTKRKLTKTTIEDNKMTRGLFFLKLDGICSQVMGTLISSAFITPLLLKIGGTSFHVGLLSAVASLACFSQLFGVKIINKFHRRKAVSVLFSTVSRVNLLILALLILIWTGINVWIVTLVFALFYLLMNVSNIAFNSWMIDFVPKEIRGRYFGSRMQLALLASAIIGFLATMYLELEGNNLICYGFVILFAATIGLCGIYFLANIPEPALRFSISLSKQNIWSTLKEKNIRNYLKLIFLLNFALNLSLPFFVYYMITILHFSVILVFAMTLLSQVCSVLFSPKWGYLIDKYGVKAVLRFSALSMFMAFLLWPFTTLPNPHVFSLFLVLIIHIVIGISISGFNLSSNLISYRQAENKGLVHILALNSIFSALGASLGAFGGALLSIPFSYMELSLTFNLYLSKPITVFIVDIRGLDFIFIISSLFGMFSISLLRKCRIDEKIDEEKEYVKMILYIKHYFRYFSPRIIMSVPKRIRFNTMRYQ